MGIPDQFRPMVWQLYTGAYDSHLKQIYHNYLCEVSPFERAITRDISRTYPKHEFFKDKVFSYIQNQAHFSDWCGVLVPSLVLHTSRPRSIDRGYVSHLLRIMKCTQISFRLIVFYILTVVWTSDVIS